jgi:hypothetical protein
MAAILALPLTASGCRVIGGIFKAGVGVGIFAVLVLMAIVGGIAALIGRRAKA